MGGRKEDWPVKKSLRIVTVKQSSLNGTSISYITKNPGNIMEEAEKKI